MEISRIKDLINIVDSKENYSLESSIKERLDKSLNIYLKSLDNSYYRIITNLDRKTMRGVISR